MLLDCAMAVCLPPNRPQFHIYSYQNIRREKMGQLDGKIAMVTGASRGMGASHARRFIAEGAQVLLTDMRADVGDALAAELGNRAAFAEHDVTNAGDWKRIVAIAEDRFGPVTVLVNNAGKIGRAHV